jgi:hypothetical protein
VVGHTDDVTKECHCGVRFCNLDRDGLFNSFIFLTHPIHCHCCLVFVPKETKNSLPNYYSSQLQSSDSASAILAVQRAGLTTQVVRPIVLFAFFDAVSGGISLESLDTSNSPPLSRATAQLERPRRCQQHLPSFSGHQL